MMILNINRARPGLAGVYSDISHYARPRHNGAHWHWPACAGWQPPHHLDNIARADCVQPTPAYFDFCCVEHLSSFSCRASESHPIGLMSHSQFTVNVWVTFQW